MAFTQEELERIVAVLREKAPNPGNCTICGNDNWEVGEEFIALVLQGDAKSLKLAGSFLPCIPVTCSKCGNTHLLNLITLGLRDLVEKKEEKRVEAKMEVEKKGAKKEEKPKVE